MSTLRWLFFVAILALAAGEAAASTPTLGNSSAFTGCGGSSTCTISVTTANANSVVVLQIGTQNAATTAPTVTGISDLGSAGLTFVRRGLAVNSNNTTCASGGTSPCSGNSEVWWAGSAATLSSESIKVTISTTGNNFTVSWGEIDGAFSISSPWDTNGSLPATNHGVNSVPSISGFATSQAHDLLLSFAHTNLNNQSYTPCAVASWGTTIANVTAGNNYTVNGRVNGVSTTQSLSPNLTSNSTCPAGNNLTDGWTVQMDAISGDAPTSPSSALLGTVPF